ncbi:MAG: hypothetical protein GEV06_06670 [Luteitalea sp.]|nr:hypothetical protein [Luteitalea sp.]
MRKSSDFAFDECVTELRAACRLPIDESALETVLGSLRYNFERHLDHPTGGKRWADHGQRVRDSARHLGAFANFFANHVGATVVGLDELTSAFKVIRADCTIQSSASPLASEFCCSPPESCNEAPLDTGPAEDFLAALAPRPRLARVG